MMFDGLRAKVAANRPPDAVREIAADERLLTWGFDTAGEPLVATDRGLWGYGERLAWVEIDHVTLTDGVLLIRAIDGEDREVPLGEPRDLPAVVKAQIEASVLHSRRVPLTPDGRGVFVVARRNGSHIEWRLQYDAGVVITDEMRDRAEAVLATIRDELGA